MGKTRVKTTYSVQGAWGATETEELYCLHNSSSDYTTFYDKHGNLESMCFGEWESGNDLWDAMNRLWKPYKGEWGISELKDGVEYWTYGPWENKDEK
jgi:hypothetical protein